jgi:hypothetical protein
MQALRYAERALAIRDQQTADRPREGIRDDEECRNGVTTDEGASLCPN